MLFGLGSEEEHLGEIFFDTCGDAAQASTLRGRMPFRKVENITRAGHVNSKSDPPHVATGKLNHTLHHYRQQNLKDQCVKSGKACVHQRLVCIHWPASHHVPAMS